MEKLVCEIAVKISEILPPETYGVNGFTIVRLITTTIEKFPQDLEIQLHGENTALANHLKIGQPYVVSLNIKSKKYAPDGQPVKYFPTIVGWRFDETTEE